MVVVVVVVVVERNAFAKYIVLFFKGGTPCKKKNTVLLRVEILPEQNMPEKIYSCFQFVVKKGVGSVGRDLIFFSKSLYHNVI